jgi:hypothetical protein
MKRIASSGYGSGFFVYPGSVVATALQANLIKLVLMFLPDE